MQGTPEEYFKKLLKEDIPFNSARELVVKYKNKIQAKAVQEYKNKLRKEMSSLIKNITVDQSKFIIKVLEIIEVNL